MRAGMIGQFPARFVSRAGFHCFVASRISAEMRVERRGKQAPMPNFDVTTVIKASR
ncbi:hypothetical protein X754_00480 [Mesorhizobium sp. LNJC403B00]|nr:hypothetical protein X754_00480 [Mesorhizobium sp. LNJC403B00]